MSVYIFDGRYGFRQEGDTSRCRQAVHAKVGVGFYQCERKPAVFRCVDGRENIGFCKQHDPEAVARRNAERAARWNAQWDATRAENERDAQQKRATAACKQAMEEIAAGHNDPRALATEVLALFPR